MDNEDVGVLDSDPKIQHYSDKSLPSVFCFPRIWSELFVLFQWAWFCGKAVGDIKGTFIMGHFE